MSHILFIVFVISSPILLLKSSKKRRTSTTIIESNSSCSTVWMSIISEPRNGNSLSQERQSPAWNTSNKILQFLERKTSNSRAKHVKLNSSNSWVKYVKCPREIRLRNNSNIRQGWGGNSLNLIRQYNSFILHNS